MKNKLEEKILENTQETQLKTESDFNIESIINPLYLVAKDLREKGYDIAGHGKIRVKSPNSNFIGILEDREPLRKRFLGISYTAPPKATHLGTLWTNNSKKGANEEHNWVLEVNGRKYLSKMAKLGNFISDKYNISLKIRLNREYPINENYLSDLL